LFTLPVTQSAWSRVTTVNEAPAPVHCFTESVVGVYPGVAICQSCFDAVKQLFTSVKSGERKVVPAVKERPEQRTMLGLLAGQNEQFYTWNHPND